MNLLMTCFAALLMISITGGENNPDSGDDIFGNDDDLLDILLTGGENNTDSGDDIFGNDDDMVDILLPGCGNRYPSHSAISTTPTPATVSKTPLQPSNRSLWHEPQPKIVGGIEAKPHSWPWMVAIYKKALCGPYLKCGASLISKHYILTAAHCFKDDMDPSNFLVLVGAHDTREKVGDWYTVQQILVHPGFIKKQLYNDMTLLKLDKPVVLGSKVHPVCLPSPSLRSKLLGSKRNVTVTGWGDLEFCGKHANVLREVELPIVPLEKCNRSYSALLENSYPRGINDLLICAGLDEGGKAFCQGDSGGPLVMQMSDSNYVQLGIVSAAVKCASPGYPGLYTRISKFTKWIRDNTDLG